MDSLGPLTRPRIPRLDRVDRNQRVADRGVELPRVIRSRDLPRFDLSVAATRTQLERGRWQRLSHGFVLTVSTAPTRLDWAAMGLLIAGGRGALSGWDAARLYGLVRPQLPSSALPVLVLAPGTVGQQRRGPLLVRSTSRSFGVRLTATGQIEFPGSPLATPARVVADTASYYKSLDMVRAIVAASVQQGLCGVDDLADELSSARRNGYALLRRALSEVGDGARSVAEVQALRSLRKAELPDFELNVPLVNSSGRAVAVADVLWRELRAVLEIDSREFHFSERDWKKTMARHNLLTAAGMTVVHYPPSRIIRDDSWLAEVRAWLHGRAAALGVDYVAGTVRAGGSEAFQLGA